MVAALFRAAWPDAKLGFAFFASKIVAAMHILMCEHAHEILAKEIILLMQQKKIQCTRKLEAMRSSVLHSVEKDLKDLDIVIQPDEVGLAGFVAIADTSKHRQHILDEICTLRCPACHEVCFVLCHFIIISC